MSETTIEVSSPVYDPPQLFAALLDYLDSGSSAGGLVELISAGRRYGPRPPSDAVLAVGKAFADIIASVTLTPRQP